MDTNQAPIDIPKTHTYTHSPVEDVVGVVDLVPDSAAQGTQGRFPQPAQRLHAPQTPVNEVQLL
ncbi:hypothetical protein E2C01_091720 [Portunus trituberculatus]|uniref:Uncharacterized protein n=1 Tax=Portunus trituberculatus TaxID=210409 RepID=A0A5B7JEP2_PORTR|nr:hypothetical protein [Portunus trituberculatus]